MRILEIGKDKVSPGRLHLVLVLCLLWALPVLANAEGVGKAIFVIGEVTLVPASGPPVILKKGQILHSGDRIDTSDKGQVQIRMIDGAFVAVRPGSSFVVKRYHMDSNPEKSESQFELIKGGFRAITGKIGKTNKKSYKVVTPVATIGIRGTDYIAMFCDHDCDQRGSTETSEGVSDGLYVGVISGGIHVDNEVSTIDVEPNQYAYVGSAVAEPQYLDSMPAFLMFDAQSPDDGKLASKDEPAGDAAPAADAESDAADPELQAAESVEDNIYDSYLDYLSGATMTQQVFATRKNFVYTLNGTTDIGVESVDVNGVQLRVVNMPGQTSVGLVGPGTAAEYDLGYDPASGLTWGRWAGGAVTTYDMATGETSSVDLGSDSLHWIAGGDPGEIIALPVTGTANYVLIGNTSPTDNLGNVGNAADVTASMVADFSTMTMDAQLTVGINNQVWQATGAGMAIDSVNATFAGGLNVDVSDNTTMNTALGSGLMTGAFSNADAASGIPANASTVYTMSSDINGTPTTVSGAGAFALVP